MRLKNKFLKLIFKTKTGKRLIYDRRFRIVLSAAVAFVFNMLYALYHCVLGIINLSAWFIAMCAFYGILASMRFSAVLCEINQHRPDSDDTEIFVMKFSGALLVVLSIVLATVNYISLSQNIAKKYEEIIMISIATYTFYKVAMSIIKAVKQRKNPSPLLMTIRNICYAEVSASILNLQRSMLVSFDSKDNIQINFMNAVTGAAVCLFVLIIGLSMISKTGKRSIYYGKIKTYKRKQKNSRKGH